MSRITLSGSSSVGKTTLFKLIEQERHKDLTKHEMKSEIVRDLIKRLNVAINKGADHRSQCLILEEHYRNILVYPNLITDRCAVDAFVYATWNYLQGYYSYQEHKEHEELFLSCLKGGYHIHFYIPIEFPAIADGVRETDEEFRWQIHILFLTIFEKYNINYVTLPGSIEERFDYFNRIMDVYRF